MAISGYLPYTQWSEADFRQYRMWKELMTPQERRERYGQLRALDASPREASRFKDWREKHFQSILDRFAEEGPAI